MDRQQLEGLSVGELHAELKKYGLPTHKDPTRCIDALVAHLERYGPLDLLGTGNPDSGSSSTVTPSYVSNATLQQSLQQLANQNAALTEQIKLLVQLNLGNAAGAQVPGPSRPSPLKGTISWCRLSPR